MLCINIFTIIVSHYLQINCGEIGNYGLILMEKYETN